MEEFCLDTFAGGSLIADLVVGPGSLSIRLIGPALYEIVMGCATGRQLMLAIWTTKKGEISTQLRDGEPWAVVRLGTDGSLDTLSASDCLMHFEHMDRGCYWMGLGHARGDTMSVGPFLTPGYLKSTVLAHVQPDAEG